MELEQTENSNAIDFDKNENEILENLDDLKNDGIETLDIMPFATPIHNWNDLKDSISLGETLVGLNSALRNHLTKYNKLIDTIAQLTRDWNSDISQLQVSLTGTHSIAKDANTKVVNLKADATQWNKDRYADISGIWSVNSSQQTAINSLDSRLKGVYSSITVDNLISNLRKDTVKWNSDRAAEISNIYTAISELRTGNSNRINDISNLRADVVKLNAERYADIETIWSVNAQQETKISNLRTDTIKWNTDRATETKNLTEAVSDLWSANTNRINDISNLRKDTVKWNDERYTDIRTIWSVNTQQDIKITDLRTDTTKWNSDRAIEILGVNSDSKARDLLLDNRLKKLESFDFGDLIDLTVLVTAVNGVKSAVNDVNKTLNKILDELDYDSANPKINFMFYLKGFFNTAVHDLIERINMSDELLTVEGSEFWLQFEKFLRHENAVYLGVLFDTMREDWDTKYWLDILETWNVTNGFLSTISGWLELVHKGGQDVKNNTAIITQWLKQIAEKNPLPPIVNVPPFPDIEFPEITFDEKKLSKAMKDALKDLDLGTIKVGDIVNEAGTNIWDVIKEGIKQAGESFRAVLDFIKNILDIVVQIVEKILELVIPSNFDFMDEGFNQIKDDFNLKFKVVLDLGKDVQDTLTPTPQDFTQSISFTFMGAEFKPDFTPLDPHIKNFRIIMSLSIWLSVAIYLFRKLTGNGDLINDN